MPKTPPLIFPNTPSWAARSKVTKKKPTGNPSIFHLPSNQRHISFEDSDEIQYIAPVCDTTQLSIDSIQDITHSDGFTNTTTPHHATEEIEKLKHPESKTNDRPSPYFDNTVQQQRVPITEASVNKPAQESTENEERGYSKQTKSIGFKEDDASDSRNSTFNAQDIDNKDTRNENSAQAKSTGQINEQFDSALIEGLTTEFQKYMEEHREIKRSIEEKKRELLLYTEERMQYLDQRKFHFQRQLKLLREYF
ncbi:hypothetical protein BD560DRAFT_447875 [Blakeslea trispora]|nr:hypothetical protein BD560DRAFT_447875 [Blakeslea trispora]